MQTFAPGQDGYREEIAGFQTGVQSTPQLVVAAADADDVAAGVRYAAAHDLPVSVQATGHGLRTPAEGVLISTRRMTGVSIDPERAVARAEAGATWGTVVEAAAEHGLAPLSGSAPGVGVVGYTLGGGFGLLGRHFGQASEHVRSAEVVLPDGTAAGGPLDAGVVTALEFSLFPVTTLYGGGLYFDTAKIADVLCTWRDWTADLPDTVGTSVALVPYPNLPVVPEPLRGKHIAHVRVASLGSAAQGERLVAPLRALGPLQDTLSTMPFTDSGKIAAEPPHPHAYLGDNRVLPALPDELLTTVLDHAGPGAPVPTVLIIDLLGGAYRHTTAADFTPDSRYTVRALSVVEPDPATVQAAHAKLFAPLEPSSTGRLRSFVYGRPLARA
ncbi:FAD-binding oxidoreductase [Amycolatopsis ultiminotia]|uniref:FAD-binding oxidoreductase n=1 Tax=Amycolatopsis ultiminotia TaxID=543629 RepID=A0ABP6YF46_9PSEU